MLINADITQLIDDQGHIVALVQPAVEQRGLATAQKAGEHHHRNPFFHGNQPSDQGNCLPAKNGTTGSPAASMMAGTSHGLRCRVTVSVWRGRR